MLTVGTAYTVPESPRVVLNEDAGWKFGFSPSGEPQGPAYDDSSFASVSLPHTWNNVDAASTKYAQGIGWYRKTITVDPAMAGKTLYLDFGAGSLVTALYVDGTQVDYDLSTPAADPHNGGFADFLFDVTARLTPGPHVVAVRVDNNGRGHPDVVPANGGDYSKQGGLYRDVSLVALPTTRVTRRETFAHAGLSGPDAATPTATPAARSSVTPVATPGVYFNNSPVVVGSPSADITVRTVLDNANAAPRAVTVTSYLVDAAGVVRAGQTSTQGLTPNQSGQSVTQTAAVERPHLWDGRIDPYLYDLYVEVCDAATGRLLDVAHERVGIRTVAVNANPGNDPKVAPFVLNGHPYALVGADMHQDSGRPDPSGRPAGWAQTASQVRADVDLLLDAGATVIRTSHYQESAAFYDYCDKTGMLVYTECPVNGAVTSGDAFLADAEDQFQELIRQTYDRPSVFAWGFGNETSSSPQAIAVFRQLNAIAHDLDPTRKTAFAQYGGSPSNATNLDGISDIKGTHRYDYWYVATQGVAAVQNVIDAYPTQAVGITEIGAGGSAYQYADVFTLPVSTQKGGVTTHFHPANQQAMIVALQMTQYESLNDLWARVVWQAFDHGSSGKNEGDQGGINDKGLATRDRVPKDAYYYFAALWNDPARAYANRKVLRIGDHEWTARNRADATVTVYSNLGPPTLFVNGKSQGVMTPLTVAAGTKTRVETGPKDGSDTATVARTYTMKVTLPVGDDEITASRVYTDGRTYSDAVTWSYLDEATFASGLAVAGGVPVERTFTYDPYTKVTANPFEYALEDGTYDLKITAPAGGVNNLRVQGRTAAIDSNGPNAADTFYARVRVTDGRLTVAAAPGAFNAAVTSLDVRRARPAAATKP